MVTFLVICGAAAALSAATGVAIKKKFWVKPKVIQSAVWDSVKQYSKDAIKAVKIFLQRTGKKFKQFVEVHFTNDSGALLRKTTTLNCHGKSISYCSFMTDYKVLASCYYSHTVTSPDVLNRLQREVEEHSAEHVYPELPDMPSTESQTLWDRIMNKFKTQGGNQ